MAKTIVIVGYGPGVSTAMAERFGAEGFSVALIARSADRLAAGVDALAAKGVAAASFPADASDPAAMREAIAKVRAQMGPISVLHWNAFGGVRDVFAASDEERGALFDVAIRGLLGAVDAALPDLKAAGDGAILVTNGALWESSPMIDAFAVSLPAMGVALANAAKHRLVGILAHKLREEGVYVGEVTIAGAIKGTPTGGEGAMDAAVVADAFWRLYRARSETYARVS